MKTRLIILLLALMTGCGIQAQVFKKSNKSLDAAYAMGTVPVVNGKVTFETTLPAEGLTAAQIKEKADKWIAKRYVEPTIISVNPPALKQAFSSLSCKLLTCPS